ncbi:MAG: lipopolysaccharide biosynthesis protein [Bacteroidia bacterium]
MLKKLFTHSFLYAIGPQIPRLASIFILPLTTAYLTPKDYGISALLMAYTGAISALKDLGIVILLVNYFYQRKLKWVILWRRLYGYILLWTPFYLIIQSFIIYLALPSDEIDNFYIILLIYAITNLIFDYPILFASRYLQFSQRPLPIALITAIVGLVAVILNYITIVEYKMGYMGWIVSSFLASFISFIFYGYYTFIKLNLWPVFKIQIVHVKNLLKITIPVIPHNYSSYLLNTSDRLILNSYNVSITQIGKYNLAYSFASYFEVFTTAVGMAVSPMYSQMFSSNSENKNKSIKKFTYLLQYIFIAIAFLASLWIYEIFNLLISNQDLKEAYLYCPILIMSFAAKPFYWSSINLLIYHTKTNKLWRITFIGGIINILLNIILIPIFGVWAAVINTFITNMFINFIGGQLKEVKELGRKNYNDSLWVILIVILTILSIIFIKQSILNKLIISFIFVIITTIKIKFLSTELNN